MRESHHRRLLVVTGLLSVLALAAAWQLASVVFDSHGERGSPVVPGWENLLGPGLKGIANYWHGGFGVEAVAEGGSKDYLTAILALGEQSLITLERVVLGFGLGALVGSGLAVIVSWSRWARRIAILPADLVRALPLLAMIPLFTLWFGISLLGMVLFTAYGTGVLFFPGVLNAIENVPQRYIQNARTLGASRFRIYRTVIIPAIVPEIHSTVMLSLGVAWSAVIGAEFLGAQDGLGQVILYAQAYGFVNQMVVVALVIVLFVVLSYLVFDRLSRRLTRWMPASATAAG